MTFMIFIIHDKYKNMVDKHFIFRYEKRKLIQWNKF